MIFERDYDTPLPVESPIEASETWSPYVSLPPVGADHEVPPTYYTGVSHAIAAFNASCRLCMSFPYGLSLTLMSIQPKSWAKSSSRYILSSKLSHPAM